MTPAAFHRRVSELLLADPLLTDEAAIEQTAQEEVHGRTEAGVPMVIGRTG